MSRLCEEERCLTDYQGETTMDEPLTMREKRLALKEEGFLSHEIADEMEAYAKELGLSTERRLAPQKAPTSKMGIFGKERPDMRNFVSQGTLMASHGKRARWQHAR